MGLSDSYQMVGGNACKGGCSTFKDFYTWNPKVPVERFERNTACHVLGERRVLLMGDSTMQQAAAVVMISFFSTKCATQIEFKMSDTLVNRGFGAWNRGKHWISHLNETLPSPNIVVVSVGAHIMQDTDFIDAISSVLVGMKGFPHIQFFWKTSQPGGCTKDVFRPESPQDAARNFSVSALKYQHSRFYDRDLYLLSRIEDQRSNVGTQTNIHSTYVTMLYSRSDAHPGSAGGGKDCLHLCVPGPLDVFVDLFYNSLLKISE